MMLEIEGRLGVSQVVDGPAPEVVAVIRVRVMLEEGERGAQQAEPEEHPPGNGRFSGRLVGTAAGSQRIPDQQEETERERTGVGEAEGLERQPARRWRASPGRSRGRAPRSPGRPAALRRRVESEVLIARSSVSDAGRRTQGWRPKPCLNDNAEGQYRVTREGMDRESPVKLDLVVPVYNEEDVLPLFLRRLDEVFTPETLRSHGIERIRFRLVDDGSRDRSAQIVGARTTSDERFVLYRLSRNFGHPGALTAGLDHADGDVVAVLDADLQDPPELVLEMLKRWREGFDVVYAQRRNRKENALKRAGYWAFYRLVSFLSELEVPLDSGDFCLIDRRVVDAMHALPERLRFPRILRAWVGFRQTGVVYDRPERQAGRSSYSFSRLYRLATDGIASSGIRLLRVAQFFSFSFAALTIVLLFALVAMLRSHAEDRMLVLFLVGYMLVAAGNFVVMACLYILGAYVGRTYLEAKGRPPYLILEVVGDDPSPQAAR